MKQNNNKDSALQRTAQWAVTELVERVATHCLPPMGKGMLFAIGFFGTTILAVAISGTIKTWTTGEVLKSSDLNTTINSLKTAIENTQEVPLGSIIAWHKNLTGTPAIPSGWAECNGQVLSNVGSVYHGQTLPNLNNAWSGSHNGRFLRGGGTSGTTQDDATAKKNLYIGSGSVEISNVADGGGYGASYERIMAANPPSSSTGRPNVFNSLQVLSGDTETRPASMTVVYIIRVK